MDKNLPCIFRRKTPIKISLIFNQSQKQTVCIYQIKKPRKVSGAVE